MTCFDAAKSKEEFGAKEWNNITNYTVARDHRKQINTELKKVTDVLVKETTSALQEKGVPMDDYVLIEVSSTITNPEQVQGVVLALMRMEQTCRLWCNCSTRAHFTRRSRSRVAIDPDPHGVRLLERGAPCPLGL